jgi:DNA polymerase-3 subunit chi|tara:strand:+ start:1121 stop:1540 length:420 start_codon:yes stop_codon:yes gene_type:complete
MTNINFYRINGGFDAALALACQLTEKAFHQGLTVLLHTADETISQELDSQLWSFKSTAFLPHELEKSPKDSVSICHHDDPGDHHGLLINLGTDTPGWFTRFEKAVEIVYDDEKIIKQKRERFSFYKSRGYPLNYHDLTK